MTLRDLKELDINILILFKHNLKNVELISKLDETSFDVPFVRFFRANLVIYIDRQTRQDIDQDTGIHIIKKDTTMKETNINELIYNSDKFSKLFGIKDSLLDNFIII